MRTITTPLHFAAMFFLDVFWFDPLPPVFLVVPFDADGGEGAAEEGGAAVGEDPAAALVVVEAAFFSQLGALQFLQHLLFTSSPFQPNLHHGKQGASLPLMFNPAWGHSPGSFNSSLYQSKVSQQTSSAHLPSRFTLSHSKLQWHLLFGFQNEPETEIELHVICLKSSCDYKIM